MSKRIEQEKNTRRRKKKKNRNLPWGIAFVIEIIIILIILILFVNDYINTRYSEVDYNELEDTIVNADLDESTVLHMTGYTTIALFGIDTRSTEMEDSRSDCIIICSINNDTQEVKLVSVYRDTFLELANNSQSYEKATHAYAYGGAQAAVNMLNKNLDLNISEYVSVNFAALTEAIEALGGLDIELKSSELPKLNECIEEQMRVNPSYTADYVYDTGVVHLNGVQATAYARIRSTDQGDITRTWRQRHVISKMVDAAKAGGLTKVMNCIDVVVDDISTSLSKNEMMGMATECFNYQISTMTGFPFTWNTTTLPNSGSIVAACDLETNVIMLHRFLYDDYDYKPSPTVQRISNNVATATGFYNVLDLDTYEVEGDVDSISH